MTRRLVSILTVIPLLISAGVMAQTQSGSQGQHQHMMSQGMMPMGSGMQDNVKMMSGMMQKMHQMMGQRQMSQEMHQQMMDMMGQMGETMRQMSTAKDPAQVEQSRLQLMEMDKRMDAMKAQMGKSK